MKCFYVDYLRPPKTTCMHYHCQKYHPYIHFGVIIHAQSNYPPIIKKHLPQMIGQRISDLSCDKAAFEKAAPEYNQALQRSGFKHTIMYKLLQSSLHRSNNNSKKKKKRNIIWFNPPFSENVATNIGKEFFSLLSNHFPPNNRYHKIFSKQNVKLSYSCMPNMGSIISQLNKQVLNRLSSADTET